MISTINSSNFRILKNIEIKDYIYNYDFIKKNISLAQSKIIYVSINKNLNQPTGFMIYNSIDKEIEILALYVSEKYRRMGLAAELLQHLETKKNIYLEVSSKNQSAIKLYKKCGYEIYNIRKSYYKDQSDAFCMVKKSKNNI